MKKTNPRKGSASKRIKAGFLALSMLAAAVPSGVYAQEETYCGHEEHKHSDECYKEELVCGKEEQEAAPGHTHTAECYKEVKSLICNQEESEEHIHSDACYKTELVLICQIPESAEQPAHHHSKECYEKVLSCGKEEHEHTLECHANLNADLENAGIWASSIPANLSDKWEEAVIQVAASQIGNKESTRNFQVVNKTKKQGYSRYGAWYGSPYGDWCAMFVSFCLNYANIPADSIPREASCPIWRSKLQSLGIWKDAGEYAPKKGDIIFYDYERDGSADHVGLVESYDEQTKTIHTIEGNVHYIGGGGTDQVMRNKTSYAKGQVMGFGSMKEARRKITPAGTLTFEGKDYKLEIEYGEEAKIPEDTELEVKELKDKEYKEALKKARKEARGQKVESARFFEISLKYDDEKIEPEAEVTTRISYPSDNKNSDKKKENTTVLTVNETAVEKKEAEVVKEDDKTNLSFKQDLKSITGISNMKDKVIGPGAYSIRCLK